MIRAEFPNKQVIVVAPPLMGHSNDLIRVCSGKKKITPDQVRGSLLPATITNDSGQVVAVRPPEYT